jgi:streptomycin 6-kinase
MPVAIPTCLAESAQHSAELASWLDTLTDQVRDLCQRWDLTVEAPFEPGGQGSWVAPARRSTQAGSGAELVLKIGWRHPESEHEAEGLRIWGGTAAIRVYAAEKTATSNILLLERCLPGTTLKTSVPDHEQDLVVADVLRSLWINPPAAHGLRPLAELAELWAGAFDANYDPTVSKLDAGLARTASAMFRDLARADTGIDQVMLCTDLHAENILASQRQSWLVIDPKPYVGDPAYDIFQHLFNCRSRFQAYPAVLAARMAKLAGLNLKRVGQWAFVRAATDSLDQPWLVDVANQLAP